MFLLLGTKAVAALLFAVTFVCSRCGTRAHQRVVRQQRKLTLFFVPVPTYRTSWSLECGHCGAVTDLTREQVDRARRWLDRDADAVR